jgi:hypothetical protein
MKEAFQSSIRSTGMLDFESGEFFAEGFGFVCA